MADLGVDTVKFLLGGVSAFDAGANLVPQFHEDELAAAHKAAQARGVWLTGHAYTPDAISLRCAMVFACSITALGQMSKASI